MPVEVTTPAPAATLSSTQGTLTLERTGPIALIGLNRPLRRNLIDPTMYRALAHAYFLYEHDPSLRAAVLFGHGSHFCEGIDVAAFAALIASHADQRMQPDEIEPWGKHGPRLSKPMVVAVHGNTWNIGHELFLACDIRVAAIDTHFAQTENAHGRVPASGSTIRLPHEAGWGNAMRGLMTGDAWNADDGLRMRTVQQIAATSDAALQAAIGIATRIAACAPRSVRTSLASAHLPLDVTQERAFAALPAQRAALYASEDFKEGMAAAAQHRAPVFRGR
jgi:enoyl-CoA hydratase